ncbi:hypothetical protein FRC06_005850, partial [Ceratobasidium sp. 370]
MAFFEPRITMIIVIMMRTVTQFEPTTLTTDSLRAHSVSQPLATPPTAFMRKPWRACMITGAPRQLLASHHAQLPTLEIPMISQIMELYSH